MINEYFPVTGAHEAVLGYSYLFRISLHGDDIQDFDTRWDNALQSTCYVPNDKILESLYKMRMRESDQLQTIMALYEQELTQNQSTPSYQKLKNVVRRRKDQKIRTRNFKPETKDLKQEYWLRLEEGITSASKGNQETATSGKQKDSV